MARYEEIPSRDLDKLKNDYGYVVEHFLPILVEVWKAVEEVTGIQWYATSYIRNSPSHQFGVSLDITPRFASGRDHGSDPVFHRRIVLLRQLQRLASCQFQYDVIIAVESDHLHLQLLRPGSLPSPVRIYQWRIPKPLYLDTYARQTAPLPGQGGLQWH